MRPDDYEHATGAAEIEQLVEQRDKARAALETLTRERNTWSRQMADLCDERDTAKTKADEEWRKRCEVDNDRTALTVRVEDAEAKLDAVRELASDILAANKKTVSSHWEGCDDHHAPCLAASVLHILDGEVSRP